MDKFQAMRTFVAVVESGSFVGAADALDMSKPAVSRYVAELEALLAVRLLHRTTRRLSLTSEGELYFAHCRELLALMADAEAEVGSRNNEASGELRLSVPVSFGERHLAPLWPAFLARHPKVALDVSLTDRTVDMVEEGIDVAVRIGKLQNSSLISRSIATSRMHLCASPQYLLAHGTPTHPADLVHHAVLAYSLLVTGDHWGFTGPGGPTSVKVTPRFRSNSGDTCRSGALQHQGIVLQPDFLIGPDLAAGTLIELMPDFRSPEFGIHAVYPTRKHVAPKVRLLVDFLIASFQNPQWAVKPAAAG